MCEIIGHILARIQFRLTSINENIFHLSFIGKWRVQSKVRDRNEAAQNWHRLAVVGTVCLSTDRFAELSSCANQVGAFGDDSGHASALPLCSFN